MKKKLIAVLLSMTMCVGMFVGCGNKEEQGDSSQGDGSQETVNIVVYNRANAQNSDKAVVDAMNAYSEEKIGVTITYVPIPSSEYKDKLAMDLAAKTEVDLCWMANYTNFESLLAQGALMDLSELLKDNQELYNVMPEKIWESTEYSGNRYIVPNYKESFTSYSVMTPVAMADTVKEKYNIDFNAIECNGIEEVGNFEEYILACMEEGIDCPIPSLVRFSSWLAGDSKYEILSGIYVADKETHEVMAYYETPEFAEYVALMEEWNAKGIRLEEAVLSDYKADPYLQSGSYAINGWTTVPDNQNQASTRYGVDVYIKEVTEKTVVNSSALGSGWCIPQHSEKAEAVMKWLTLLNTDTEFADIFVYGIEGVNYTREADGTVTAIADSGWTNATWKVTNYMISSLLSSDAADKKEQYEQYNNEAVEMVHLGFRPDLSEFSAEDTTINAIDKEVAWMYDLGLYGTEDLQGTLQDMNKAGLEKVKAEIQRQLDEFLAAK